LELADETNRCVTLIDLAGHPKFLKTTLHGLIGRKPDHCVVCISATTGLNSMTAEHIGLSMYLNVPLIVVITKVDRIESKNAPTGTGAGAAAAKVKAKGKYKAKNCYTAAGDAETTQSADSTHNQATSEQAVQSGGGEGGAGNVPQQAQKQEATTPLQLLVSTIRQVLSASQKEARYISSEDQLVHLLLDQSSAQEPSGSKQAVVPVFAVSNTTGSGMQLLKSYLFQLPTHAKRRQRDGPGASAGAGGSTSAHMQSLSTCVRILGSIGNVEEIESAGAVSDHDENISGSSMTADTIMPAGCKPARPVHHSRNRYSLSAGAPRTASSASDGGDKGGALHAVSQALAVSSSCTNITTTTTTPTRHGGSQSVDSLSSSATAALKELASSAPGSASALSAAACHNSSTPMRRPKSAPELDKLAAIHAHASPPSSSVSPALVGRSPPKSTLHPQYAEFSDYVEAAGSLSYRTKVLIGSIESGKLSVGKTFLFGPTSAGKFVDVSEFILLVL
jgi:hypothetical protein